MKKISLFTPVYNGEKLLEKNIRILYDKLKEDDYNFELFIIDDSSTDSTPVIGVKMADEHKEIQFVRYDNGPSRRENLAKSFSLAKGDIVAFMDIDLAVDLEHFKELMKSIEDGYDIVTGSRHMKAAIVKRSLLRGIISIAFKYFIKFYFNSKINDHQCGFKAFKKEVILKLVDEMGYDTEFKRKFFWDSELLIRAQKKAYKIKEIPVQWNQGEESTFKLQEEMSMIPYLLKLKTRL